MDGRRRTRTRTVWLEAEGSPVGPEGVRSEGVGKIVVGLDFDVHMGGRGVVNGARPRAIVNLTGDSSFLNRPHRGRCLGGSFLHRGLRESVGGHPCRAVVP